MSKLALYVFDGGELEDVIEGLNKIKEYIVKYESRTKRGTKEVQRDSREAQCTSTNSN